MVKVDDIENGLWSLVYDFGQFLDKRVSYYKPSSWGDDYILACNSADQSLSFIKMDTYIKELVKERVIDL